MPIRERFRAAVRRFLGLDELSTKHNLANVLKMLQNEREHTNERLDHIDHALNTLTGLLFQPKSTPGPRHLSAMDWDQAQARALAELEQEAK